MVGFDVVATGRAAHSGYPWLGQSAVSAILPALLRVDKLGDILSRRAVCLQARSMADYYYIGRVDAGVAGNVVPKSGKAIVAVRLAAGTPQDARRIIKEAVYNATNGNENVYVDFASHPECYAPQDLDTDVDGFNVTTVNYGTDVPNLQIPTNGDHKVRRYLYGPGSILVAHGDNEGLTVAALRTLSKDIADSSTLLLQETSKTPLVGGVTCAGTHFA